MEEWLEFFWAEMLSRETKRVRTALYSLEDENERAAVILHLRRMATEDGWSESQRLSAQAALDALVDTDET
jgi:hypothetical protein